MRQLKISKSITNRSSEALCALWFPLLNNTSTKVFRSPTL